MTLPPDAVVLPTLCDKHQRLLVVQCGYGPQHPWRALMISTQLALFQGASCDSKVYEEITGDAAKMHTLGCLACRKPDLFGEIVGTVQRTFPRSAHVKAIKELGEKWVFEAQLKPAEGNPS